MEDYILSSCLPFDADPFGLFAIDSQDGLHRQEYDATSPYIAQSDEASAEPTSRSPPDRDYPVCCLYPGCNSKPFKRRADLDRHYKHRHAAEDLKASFNCDYPHCNRRKNSFHRLDHFRDHLREFHKENIQKRGSKVDEKWLEESLSLTWWRCPKCLNRINIRLNGYKFDDFWKTASLPVVEGFPRLQPIGYCTGDFFRLLLLTRSGGVAMVIDLRMLNQFPKVLEENKYDISTYEFEDKTIAVGHDEEVHVAMYTFSRLYSASYNSPTMCEYGLQSFIHDAF
ncbi:hypothetical protein E4U14_005361 [Claviceps sp. LM454 group G7]|nr:hypothetical protein E4U14_005361 [Claviceps sp. LM454 group G7]